jgi:GDP-4-dehydro-6-deoxy-D-mannose reductase
VCAGRPYAIREVLDRLVAMSRAPLKVTVDPARYRPSDNVVVWGDRSRIGRELGWSPQITLDQTLADVLEYWRKEIQ